MRINVTAFVTGCMPFDYSASQLERGANAGPETWRNALQHGSEAPLLTTPEQLQALRDHMYGFGAWTDEEIAGWSDAECNALLVQLISGDMREAGMDGVDWDDFDWNAYEEDDNNRGALYRGDDGQIYYDLGD